MARKDVDWLKLQVEYESGTQIRELERKFNVPESTIRFRIKKHGWDQKLRTQISESIEQINEITKNYAPAQKTALNTILHDKLDTLMQLSRISNINLKTHEIISTKTHNMLIRGEYEPHQAASILRMQNQTITDIAKSKGIDVESSQSNDDEEKEVVRFYLPASKR